jgi:hypothetical protein
MSANGDLVASFAGAGTYLHTSSGGGWQQLTTAVASRLAMDANGDVFGEFPGAGVYFYKRDSGSWQNLTPVDAAFLFAA